MISPLRDAGDALARFALRPGSARPLAALRAGVAATLLGEALQCLPALFTLYGEEGVLTHGKPQGGAFPHVVALLSALGLSSAHAASGTVAAYLIALALLFVGYRTRAAAGAAWMLHAILFGDHPGERRGADELSHMALFYLMWTPAGAALSVDRRRLHTPEAPTAAARLGLRVIQIHLCLLQASNGIEKATGEVWRNGEAIWKALMLPEYRRFDFSFLASHPWIPTAAGWAVMLFEISYPLLVWHRRTRIPWVVMTSLVHLGIATLMGLGSFAALMIVLTVSAFGVRADPLGRGRGPGYAGRGPHERA